MNVKEPKKKIIKVKLSEAVPVTAKLIKTVKEDVQTDYGDYYTGPIYETVEYAYYEVFE